MKITQRTTKNSGTVFIDFNNLTDSKPFYVFEQDGEAFASNTEAGSWYGEIVPTGRTLDRFNTLDEAKAKYPAARITEEAEDASNFIC